MLRQTTCASSCNTADLGYIRVADIGALTAAPSELVDPRGTPDINMNARGCVTQSGALLALALLLALTVLTLVYISQASVEEQGIVALVACVSLGPLLLVTIAIFVYARSRDERLAEEAEELGEQASRRAGEQL